MKILTTKTLQRLLVTGALMLLINGCDDTVSVEQNTSTESEVNVTVTPTVNPTVLSLSVGATTLNKTDHANLTLMGSYADGSTKPLETQAEWIVLPTGSVDVNGTTFTALKDGNVTVQAKVGTTLSNTINLNITWVVNGHVLPPEPDPAVNNATLGGVDSNNNGVRDDVERNIYATYPVKLQRELLMYGATVFQEAVTKPLSEAKDIADKDTKAINCQLYLRGKDSKIKSDEFDTTTFLENKTFNTKERIKKYLDYNIALSGGVYGSSPKDWNREACTPEIVRALEEMGK